MTTAVREAIWRTPSNNLRSHASTESANRSPKQVSTLSGGDSIARQVNRTRKSDPRTNPMLFELRPRWMKLHVIDPSAVPSTPIFFRSDARFWLWSFQ